MIKFTSDNFALVPFDHISVAVRRRLMQTLWFNSTQKGWIKLLFNHAKSAPLFCRIVGKSNSFQFQVWNSCRHCNLDEADSRSRTCPKPKLPNQICSVSCRPASRVCRSNSFQLHKLHADVMYVFVYKQKAGSWILERMCLAEQPPVFNCASLMQMLCMYLVIVHSDICYDSVIRKCS